MASYREYRTGDNARMFINIDDILQAFSSAERAEGLPETFKQIVSDKPTKSKCDKCKAEKCEVEFEEKITEKKKTPFACGNFDMSLDGADIDDEDDDIYVCDMCDKLGYSGKYIPEICDTCKACAGCNEYDDGECSGCSYSVYRDGEYYHDKLPESELISAEDIQLFNDLERMHSRRMQRQDGVGKFRNR